MLKLICGGLRFIPTQSIRPVNCPRLQRPFGNDSHSLLIGGGLAKLQGGPKEESYFRSQNYELITKIRQQGSKLKCENCLRDWTEFEKISGANVVPCSANKHKNGWEEAFFMNEQNECSKHIKEKLLNDSRNFEYQKRNETSEIPLAQYETKSGDLSKYS